jgi:hypothetical protein
MNPISLTGLVIGIVAVVAYATFAASRRKKAELVNGIVVFVGAVSIAGAVRLIGFVFTEQFAKIAATSHSTTWWSLSLEDAVFLVIGGIALAWVSVQTIWESFAKVK